MWKAFKFVVKGQLCGRFYQGAGIMMALDGRAAAARAWGPGGGPGPGGGSAFKFRVKLEVILVMFYYDHHDVAA